MVYSEEIFETLKDTVSVPRLGTYLKASGYNKARAVHFYHWNSMLCQSLYLPIQSIEVSLRNRINFALISQYGENWWHNDQFKAIAEERRMANINDAKRRIKSKKHNVNTGQIVATLTLGFWVAMLDPRYNSKIWSRQLRTTFPNLPANKDRKHLHSKSKQVANLRNRISHHEPIFKGNLMEDYSGIMQLQMWMCPNKQAWVKSLCDFPKVSRQRP
jgi:hypothetical protein|tara:strand:+ start:1209 stop:1856 length:648 start_codon:yes stop_codon:yes gene_type:complete